MSLWREAPLRHPVSDFGSVLELRGQAVANDGVAPLHPCELLTGGATVSGVKWGGRARRSRLGSRCRCTRKAARILAAGPPSLEAIRDSGASNRFRCALA